MDRNLLIKNIERYSEAIGKKPTPACAEAGLGKDFLSDIRRGRVPSVAKVADLAAYLGCTISDLVGDARQSQQPSELTKVWNRLDETDRAQLVGFARGLAAAEKYTEIAWSDRKTAG